MCDDKFTMNRIANAGNKFQGSYKRVLCVCSAGLLRSPTAALVLSKDPYNFNTRACGAVPEFALIALNRVLVEWADEIVCMEKEHMAAIESLGPSCPVICLDISDSYEYRNEELQELIKTKYDKAMVELKKAEDSNETTA